MTPSPPSSPATLDAFEPLLRAELIVLRAAAAGAIAKVSYHRPAEPAPDLQVRAEFLAFLAHGGSASAPVAGGRLQVLGALIVGSFDLSHQRIPTTLWFFRCTFSTAPLLSGAHFNGSLSFPGCELPGLMAEALRVDGELEFSAGCTVRGELVLTRAHIARELNCERLQLLADERPDGARTAPRLLADGIRVDGDVVLSGGVQTTGEVNFMRAHIGGDLRASGARLGAALDGEGLRGAALVLERVRIGGHLLLDGGVSVAGQVRLQRASIGGDLDCNGADFDIVGDAGWDDAAAVIMDRATIGGALNLQRLQRPLEGSSFVDATTGTLLDDAQTWGTHHSLDGFSYTRFGADSPTDAAMRLGWLATQRGEETRFRPDPWRRAIRVLRRMGRDDSAAEIAIGRERHLRRNGQIGLRTPAAMRWLPRLCHALFGAFAGYGHRPLRLLAACGVLWLACAGVYWAAADAGVMASIDTSPTSRPMPLQPLVYSLDVLMPLVDLHQQRHWAPLGTNDGFGSAASLVQALIWFEAFCGSISALMLLAIATGAADRDRDWDRDRL